MNNLTPEDCVPPEFREFQRMDTLPTLERVTLGRMALREHVMLVGHTYTQQDFCDGITELLDKLYGGMNAMVN